MNKAVVVFFVHELVESRVVLGDEDVALFPLFVPAVRMTVSGVPPFISNESIEKELVHLWKATRWSENCVWAVITPDFSSAVTEEAVLHVPEPSQQRHRTVFCR